MPRMKRFYTILGWVAIIYMVVLFLYPLLKVITTSFTVNGAASLDNYGKVFASDVYVKVLGRTMWISIVSTVISIVLGYGLAYFIVSRPSKSQGLWLMLIISPMFMSLTVRLFGWMIILSNEGPISAAISKLWQEGQQLSLLFSPVSVIIGIVHYVLPFVVLNIYTSLKKMNASILEASTMLGASAARTFWNVTFPLTLPGVFAGGSVAFALAANTFLVPIMLGGPSSNLLSNLAYNSIITIGNFGLGSALSIVLLMIVVLVLVVLGMWERRGHSAS
jgi:ABC-type spermidine/putrescine transport system permease subunit I